jgi:hypothetical protein
MFHRILGERVAHCNADWPSSPPGCKRIGILAILEMLRQISFQTESRCSAVVERQAACPEQQIYLRPTTKHSVIGPSEFVERRYPMDRLHQITNEIIRLYREQINFWGLGRTSNLKDADLLQYDRRRDRLNELRRELEGSRKATV